MPTDPNTSITQPIPDVDGSTRFLAQKQYQDDATTAAAYLNAHPERAAAFGVQPPATPTPAYVPGSGTPGLPPPDLSILTPEQKAARQAADVQAGQQAGQASQAAGEHIKNLELATTAAEQVQRASALAGMALPLAMGGTAAIPAIAGGVLALKAQEHGGAIGADLTRRLVGEGHPNAEAIGSLVGSVATGLLTPGIGPLGQPKITAPGDTIKNELGTILDQNGNPMPASAPSEPMTAAAGPLPPAQAAASVAGAGEPVPTQAATTLASTPQSALSDLGMRQVEALRTARVGQTTAEEMGAPQAATVVPEMQTLAEAQNLRASVEGPQMTAQEMMAARVTTPEMAARVAAKASFYHDEARSIRSLAQSITEGQAAGVDTSSQKAELANRFSAYAISYANLAGMRSDVGRSLQILDPLKPENLMAAETARLAQSLTTDDVNALVEKLTLLPPEEQASMARAMAESTASGRSVSGMVREYYYNALLSKVPRIAIKKMLGDFTSWALNAPTRAIAARMPQWGNGPFVAPGEANAYLRGTTDPDAFGDALAAARLTWQNNESAVNILGGGKGGEFEPTMPIGVNEIRGSGDGSAMSNAADLIGSIVNTPTRAIMAEHEFSRFLNFRGEWRALALRQVTDQARQLGLEGEEAANWIAPRYSALVANGSPELMQAAHAAANANTFSAPLGPMGQAMSDALEKSSDYVPGLARGLFPFRRVPINIDKFAMSYSGPFSLLTHTFWSAMKNGGADGQLALAKLGMGMGFFYVAVKAAQDGLLTPGNPSDPTDAANQRAEGFQPYSFTDGKNYVSFDSLEPLGIPLGLAADWLDIMKSAPERDAQHAAVAATMAVGRNLSRQSYVQTLANVNSLIDELRAGTSMYEALGKLGARELSGLVPAALRGEAQREDPVMRDARGFFDTLLKGVPGRSKDMPPIADLLDAKPIPVPPGFMANEVYPWRVGAENNDPIYHEIANVRANVPRPPDMLPGSGGKAPGFFVNDTDPNVGVPLDKWQRYKWQQIRATTTDEGSGLNLRGYLAGLIKDQDYQELSQEDKGREITRVIEMYGRQAAKEMTDPLSKNYDAGLAQQLAMRQQYRALGHLPPGKNPAEFLRENGIEPLSGVTLESSNGQ